MARASCCWVWPTARRCSRTAALNAARSRIGPLHHGTADLRPDLRSFRRPAGRPRLRPAYADGGPQCHLRCGASLQHLCSTFPASLPWCPGSPEAYSPSRPLCSTWPALAEGGWMDHHAALTHPLDGVFRRLATPACLGDWLPEVACVRAGPVPPGVGDVFSLALG